MSATSNKATDKRVQYDGRHSDDEKPITGEKPEVSELNGHVLHQGKGLQRKETRPQLQVHVYCTKNFKNCKVNSQLALRLSNVGVYVMASFESYKEWGVILYPRQDSYLWRQWLPHHQYVRGDKDEFLQRVESEAESLSQAVATTTTTYPIPPKRGMGKVNVDRSYLYLQAKPGSRETASKRPPASERVH
ncbi:hypothetical protein Tco_1313211 [Tanacetum coccineum]